MIYKYFYNTATCVLLPSASGNISGGSLLGHAMQVYHDGLQDGDWRIVKTCRRSILMLRPILHPQVAPMRTFEPKIAPVSIQSDAVSKCSCNSR